MSSELRILVVEDDMDASANMRDILELDNYEVEVVGTAADAMQCVQQPWDVVIVDRKLPDAMAEDWLSDLHDRLPNCDIIVVTAYADMNSTIAAFRIGVADYILKPINPDALRASLKRVVERRWMEHRLHQEHEFAAQVLSTAEAIVLVLDLDAHIVRFNPYLTKISEYPIQDVEGKCWFETFLPPEDHSRIREFFKKTVAGMETQGIINPILTRSGRLRQIRWSNTTLKDEHGETVAVLSVGLDVTDFIEAQRQALQAQRLATIGQTMAALAHESRNALQRIQARAEVLSLEFEPNSQAMEDVKSIQRSAKELHNLFEEVRSFAAPINLNLENCRISDIWQNAWHHLQMEVEAHAAQLIECKPPQDATVIGDRVRLEQVFRNLFENSIAAGGQGVCINIACQTIDSGWLEIEVSDNGPGLSDEQRERLFEAFYTTKSSGTGLGMAIVRRIVEAHGGSVQVANPSAYPNASGAKFLILLPHKPPMQP